MEPHIEYFMMYEIYLENAEEADRLHEALNKEIGCTQLHDRIFVKHEVPTIIAVEMHNVRDIDSTPWWLLTKFDFKAKCEMVLNKCIEGERVIWTTKRLLKNV